MTGMEADPGQGDLELISSRRNPLVGRLRALHQGRGRREQQRLLLEGTHLLQEVLRLGLRPDWLLATAPWMERHGALLAQLRQSALQAASPSRWDSALQLRVVSEAVLAVYLKPNDRRQDYMRATSDTDSEGRRRVTPFARQDSSMMSRLAAADCLVVRPPHDPARQRGERVTILPLDGGFLSI